MNTINFHLNNEDKTKIIQALAHRYEEAQAYEEEDLLKIFNNPEIQKSIQLLQNEGILSLNLIMAQYNLGIDEEVSINEEEYKQLFIGMSDEEYSEKIHFFNKKNGKFSDIKSICFNSKLKNDLEIQISPELAEKYKKLINIFQKVYFKDGQAKATERITNGVIKYEDIEKLVSLLEREFNLKIETLELFQNGEIDISQIRRKFLARSSRNIFTLHETTFKKINGTNTGF